MRDLYPFALSAGARCRIEAAGRPVPGDGRRQVAEVAADVRISLHPDRSHAERWYASAPYQAIIPLRSDNSDSTVFLIDGVDRDHQAIDVLSVT